MRDVRHVSLETQYLKTKKNPPLPANLNKTN